MNEIQRRKKESHYLLWIAKIINEDVKNANIKNITVVDVRLSNDGSDLKVYVLINQNEKKALETLNNIKGYIRKELANYDHQSRKVPNIVFKIDEAIKKGEKIEAILKEIKEKEKHE